MYTLGEPTKESKHLIKTTYEAMWKAIKTVKPNSTLGDIGHAIQKHVQSKGYSVVREYCGHGIGIEMHEEPQVLHYGRPNTGLTLRPGMTFTIEPMINQGKSAIKTLKDDWTVVTKDNKLSAQWEHTILVTDTGYEVLTLREEELEA
jgi:methionyl aminopeptidase